MYSIESTARSTGRTSAVDLAHALVALYEKIQPLAPAAREQLVVDAVARAAQATPPLCVFDAATSRTLRRPPHVVLLVGTPTTLEHLETVGYALFAHTPVGIAAYEQWARRPGAATTEPLPADAVTPRTDLPEGLRSVFELLQCYRTANRPVGIYWLFPLLVWMLAPRPWGWPLRVVAERVPACPVRTTGPAVCEGLPPGCAVRVYHWRAREWRHLANLVKYVMQYQCQVLAGRLREPLRALRPCQRSDPLDVDPHMNDALLLVVGGTPLATAIVSDLGSYLYVDALCAHTSAGGGSMMVQHLQSLVYASGNRLRSIRLSVWDPAGAAFYRARGWEPLSEFPDGRELVWQPT